MEAREKTLLRLREQDRGYELHSQRHRPLLEDGPFCRVDHYAFLRAVVAHLGGFCKVPGKPGLMGVLAGFGPGRQGGDPDDQQAHQTYAEPAEKELRH